MVRRIVLGMAAFAAVLTLSLPAQAQTVITQWNFNQAGFNVNNPAPSTGGGAASLLTALTGSSASGTVNGGSSDPGVPNTAWGTTSYPAQGTGSGTAGVRFNVSTVGFENIIVNFDVRKSNTSSRYVSLDYTTDGTNFTSFQTYDGNAGDTWFNNQSADLSAILAANDNANFGVRVVSIFDPALGNAYSASNSASSYAAGGTLRYDMVTISGTAIAAVPEPTSLALLGLAGAGFGYHRWNKGKKGARRAPKA